MAVNLNIAIALLLVMSPPSGGTRMIGVNAVRSDSFADVEQRLNEDGEPAGSFNIQGCGDPQVDGTYVAAGMHNGRPEYVRSPGHVFIIHWSNKRKGWRLFAENRHGFWRKTLYLSAQNTTSLPLSGWTAHAGANPPPGPVINNGLDEIALGAAFVPPDEMAAWASNSGTRACRRNGDTPEIQPLESSKDTLVVLAECLRQCKANVNCAAVDWFSETGHCLLYPAGCSGPLEEGSGASSWTMTQSTLQERACQNWKEDMPFMGEGWMSTDRGGKEAIDSLAETLAQVFDGCTDQDEVSMYYAERDVGYDISGTIKGYLKNKILMHMNDDYKLFHSGVRLFGCGKSLVLQLQARAWGWPGAAGSTPFGLSFPYPVTAPDRSQVWKSLSCPVPGRGMRDVGAGNIIFYRTRDESEVERWARSETKILSFKHTDIGNFIRGLTPYLSWWNVQSKYYPETVLQKNGYESVLLREALVCDSFSLWLLSQGMLFAKLANYGLDSFHVNTTEHPKYNQARVTIGGAGGSASGRPHVGDPARWGLSKEYIRSRAAVDRDTLVMWETVKGHGECQDIVDVAQQASTLARDWQNKSFWSVGSSAFSARAPYVCTERIWKATSEADMVQFGPWRFFDLGGDRVAMSLDWNTKVLASYDTPFPLYDPSSGAVQLPGGTPRGPFGDGVSGVPVPPNPCGKYCAWEFPVPPPPEEGYALAR